MKLSFRAAFCGVLALLSACAGNQAMQWRPPPKKSCQIVICEVHGKDRMCGCGDIRDVRMVLGQ
jgi:hypothetical protein